MPTLKLVARFPLGVYIGHKADGSLDLAPSPARLHSALLNAAAQGTRGEDGQPNPESIAALEWLENNPPDALFQPESLVTSTSPTRFMYRKVGTFTKSKSGGFQDYTEARSVASGVSVASTECGFGYQWNDVPIDVADTIVALAEDVACLGETHSVVVLERGEFDANLFRNDDASAFTPGSQPRDVATSGRTQALISQHNAQFRKKPSHRFSMSAKPGSIQPTGNYVEPRRYMHEALERDIDAPWTEAYFFRLDKQVPEHRRVELCTTMHKTLIAQIGNDVSPVITGKFLAGTVERPANRLAIQYLPEQWARVLGFDAPQLVLFVPKGTAGEDLRQIRMAENITQLWSRKLGRVNLTFSDGTAYGDEFWPAPKNGTTRLWKPLIPLIPETRPVRLRNVVWSLADAALLSMGYVWRDDFVLSETGQKRYVELRDAVRARGAAAMGAQTVPVKASDYVHRTHRDVPVQPFTALIYLGELSGERTAVMLGQSRHLGGGMLVPVDVEGNLHA